MTRKPSSIYILISIIVLGIAAYSQSEVLVRKDSGRGDFGFVAENNVSVGIGKVWKIITDFPRYPEFQKTLYFTRIINESSEVSTVSFQMDDGVGGSLDFILVFRKDLNRKKMSFTSKGTSKGIKKIEGEILLQEVSPGTTKVRYSIFITGKPEGFRIRKSFKKLSSEFVGGIEGQSGLYSDQLPTPVESGSPPPPQSGCVLPSIKLPPHKGKKIYAAVLKLVVSGKQLPKELSTPLTDSLMSSLLKTGRVSLLNRENMEEILSEQNLQQTGYCNEQGCAVQIGRLLGVEKIITGSISQVNTIYFVSLQMVNLETGNIEKMVNVRCSGSTENLFLMLDHLSKKLFASP